MTQFRKVEGDKTEPDIQRCEFECFFVDMPILMLFPLPNEVFSRKRRRHVNRNYLRNHARECKRRLEQATKERQ